MYEKFVIHGELYSRTAETVNITLTAANYYYYYKDDLQGFAFSSDTIINDGVNLRLGGRSAYTPALILVPYSNDNALDDSNERLPAGVYRLSTANFYGISTEPVVSSPEDLFIVWYPPIEDDPVHNFLKNQSTSFAGTKTPIRWKSNTFGKKLRVYRANQLISGYIMGR